MLATSENLGFETHLLIIDVGNIQVCVDVVSECLVANSWHAVAYHFELYVGKVKWQENAIQQSFGGPLIGRAQIKSFF